MAQKKAQKAEIRIAKGAKSGPFAVVEDAVAAIRRGEMVIVVDDEDRENEGDLTMAAEKVTPEAINFMAKHGRGLICMPMTGERLDELEIPLMVEKNSTRFETAFCVAIEAKLGTSTGISAAVPRHEVDRLGRHLLGGHRQIAFVLAILVVHDDDQLAGADGLDGLID